MKSLKYIFLIIILLSVVTVRSQPKAKDLNLHPVLMNNIKLQGILVGSKAGLAAMCKAFDFHKTKPIIDKVFSFEESIQAIEYLKTGSHFGKIVISL